jgi:hypothetical protein
MDSVPDTEAPLPPLPLVERSPEITVKGSEQGDGMEAGRCRPVQVSERFSIEECKRAVLDFLVPTEVRKFPPKVKYGQGARSVLGAQEGQGR